MAIQTWGSLQKSTTDDETIEQAIGRLISDHEEDSSAHLGAGESLQSHKNADVIDHPALSVVDDKIIKNRITLETFFESITSLEVVGSSFNAFGLLKFYTTSSLNNVANVRNLTDEFPMNIPDLTKNPIFECVCIVEASNSYQAYIGIGDLDTFDGIGFEFSGTSSYVVYYKTDNVKYQISLSGINPKVLHKWRVEILDGVSVLWFVDNVQVASISLASITLEDPNQGIMWTLYLKNLNAGTVPILRTLRLLFQQDFLAD